MIVQLKSKLRTTKGFTLVEVAIGMAIFVMLLISGSAAIMHNTARTVVEGYMEQMKGISYYKFQEALADKTKVPIETMGISSLKTGTDIYFADPLYLDVENKKEVLLDLIEEKDGSFTPNTMNLYITPTITDITATEGLQVLEITLEFTYESIYNRSAKAYTNSIRFIKTSVSEY
jgi:prepilin-type N-terminal cleavage/methylation domain-containing protein